MSSDDPRVVEYHFESAAFPGEDLPIGSLTLVEALNEPYRMRVSVALTNRDADPAQLLGRDVTLRFRRSQGSARVVHGIVRQLTEGESVQDAPIADMEVVPALALLAQRRNSRIFQHKSVPQILGIVLAEGLGAYAREAASELQGSYPTREYCVQYQESDLEFVHRLMEEEGISYAFDHDGDVEKVVLRDRNASFAELSSGAALEYQPHNFEISGREPICRFERRTRPRVTSVVVRDWDWTRGGDMKLAEEARSQGADARDREAYEHGRGRSLSIWSYDQAVRKYQAHDAPAQAALRREAHAWDALVGRAISRVVAAAPGLTFELCGHPSLGVDGQYLITRVEHVREPLENAIRGSGASDPYYNRIECIPLDVAYRPERRTRKPRIAGVQTAVVVGPANEEIHVDEHGRIRIQLHWDREGRRDEHSTCWVRVQQPWAGSGWGFFWVPRIGMEVMVHYVDGDPDRPLVSASLYNGTNPTPYPLPDEKTKSTIKSHSSLGGRGFNELRFEDRAGREEIYAHAQRDYNEVVEHDHDTKVLHDQSNTVDHDQTQTVTRHQAEDVDVDQRMTVEHDRTVQVKSNFDEIIDGSETRHTKGNVQERFDANEQRSVRGNVVTNVTGTENRTVRGSQSETITGTQTVRITGASTQNVTGSWSRRAVGGISTITPSAYSITTTAGFTATAGTMKLIAPAGMKVLAVGGMTRIDSSWFWLGNKKMCVGANASAAYVFKFGSAVFGFTFVGLRIDDTGIKVKIPSFDLTNSGTQLCFDKAKMVVCSAAHIDAAMEVKA